jgi:hypothetical protein
MSTDAENKGRFDCGVFRVLAHRLSLSDKATNPQGTRCAIIFAVFACKLIEASRHHRTMIYSARTISARVSPRSQEELSALPIWAVTLGIFALLTFGLTAVPSIICGHLALARNRASEHGSFAKSVALAGLVIGYLGVVVLGTWIAILARHLF